jgi:hypothetical protein
MLPKIDTPIYDLFLPLSEKKIRFRPFLVKEQKNLLMAMESDNKEDVEKNIRQVLTNCTLTEGINIDTLPVIDVEYYFINLRARSVGEIVENEYVCNNVVDDKICGGKMKGLLNLLDINVNINPNIRSIIQLSDKVSMKLKYPEYSLAQKLAKMSSAIDIVFEIVTDSIEWIYDGEQYYYAHETPKKELLEYVESLNTEQFNKIEEFFNNLPTIKKTMEMKCGKCDFDHSIEMEGLESFFE